MATSMIERGTRASCRGHRPDRAGAAGRRRARAPIRSGVYQALHEAGIEPDWVIGTSIGAINASLIAGNEPADRLARLKEFWRRVEHGPFQQALGAMPLFGAHGVQHGSPWRAALPTFFKPNPLAFMGDAHAARRRRRPAIIRPRRCRRR